MRSFSYLTGLTFSLLLMTAFQNCSPVAMTSMDDSQNGKTGLKCSTTFERATGPVKVIFLIDRSGSNDKNDDEPGTDPDRRWRSSVMENFIAAYKTKSNFSYNLTTFANSSSNSLVNVTVNGKSSSFTNDLSVVDAALTAFEDSNDSGNTPYKSALNKAKSMIQKDLDEAAEPSVYSIIMISDGEPNPDYNKGNDMAAIHEDVQKIINMAPEQINLNTVYYNNYKFTAKAENILRSMAEVSGQGSFVKANSNSVLDIKDSFLIPKTDCK